MSPRFILLTLSFRNLGQHRVRSLLSVLIVALGVATVIGIDSASAAILNSLAGSEDAQTFMAGLLDEFDRLLYMVGLMVTLVVGFLVFNSFSIAITQRRRQIGALRLLGVTRRQLFAIILGEAALIGTLGVLAGAIIGPALGKGTIRLIKTILGEATFTFQEATVPSSIIATAVGLGLGITLLAVLLPAWRAMHLSPLDALRSRVSANVSIRPSRLGVVGFIIGVLLFSCLAVTSPGTWLRYPLNTLLTWFFELVWFLCLGLTLPWLIGWIGNRTRRVICRLSPATGRLIADNLRRDRARVTLLVASIALGLALISTLAGFFRFAWDDLFSPRIESALRLQAWIVSPFNIAEGMTAYNQLDSLRLPAQVPQDIVALVADRGEVMEWHFVIVPELSFFGEAYFSFIADHHSLRRAGNTFFEFMEGDWEFAGPIMDSGCGVLVAPLVAEKNGLTLGQTFTVEGIKEPVTCHVAGIGSPYVGATLISQAAGPAFGVTPGETQPITMVIWPLPEVDRPLLSVDLEEFVLANPPVQLATLDELTGLQKGVIENLPIMVNVLSLVAIIAVALGVVNTTMLNVVERRRELSLVRALGATRGQVRNLVVGEAALMGVIGGGFGIIAGVGALVILVVTYGGRSWGIPDLDLWEAALRATQPAVINGLLGLFLAPVLSGLGAWIPWWATTRRGRSATEELRRAV